MGYDAEIWNLVKQGRSTYQVDATLAASASGRTGVMKLTADADAAITAPASTKWYGLGIFASGTGSMADVSTGRIAALYIGKTATPVWPHGIYIQASSVLEAIRVGELSSAAGSGVKVDITNTCPVKVYADDNAAAIAAAGTVSAIRGRLLRAATVQTESEFFAVRGQLVSSGGGTYDHNDAAVFGSLEHTTVAGSITGTSGDNIHAGVLGRVGVTITATTVSATGALAGLAAMSNVTSTFLTVTTGGVFAGLYVGKHTGTQSWEWGAYLLGTKQGISVTSSYGALTAGEVYGINVSHTVAAMTSGTSTVGVNAVVNCTTSGNGMWAAAFYGKVNVGTVHSVGGYICGAEFEVAIGASAEDCNRHVLVLNYTSEGTFGLPSVAAKSFIQLRNYGTQKLDYFLDLPDEAAGADRMLRYVDGSEPTWTNTIYVKCRFATTDFWLVGSADAPNS